MEMAAVDDTLPRTEVAMALVAVVDDETVPVAVRPRCRRK